jgi:hypothetical protein
VRPVTGRYRTTTYSSIMTRHFRRARLSESVGALLVVGSMLGLSAAASANTSAKSPISVRIALSRTVVIAGESIQGVAIMTNSTNNSILVRSCARDGWLFVGIANQNISFSPIVAGVACAGSIHLKPGANRFLISVSTSYQQCSQGAGDAGGPHCTSSGMPPLPKGSYHTSVVILGLPTGTANPATRAITLK